VREGSAQSPQEVRELFTGIARCYDLANHLLSCGFDWTWRRRAARIVKRWTPQTILDVAAGSGDLALAMQRAVPKSTIVGADFAISMLLHAQEKGVVNCVCADALTLPFADGTFEVVTVAFGLRNMKSWGDALREMRRVLRAGGHLLVLDFSLPNSVLLRAPYRFYLHRVLPLIAERITGDEIAYKYLCDSIETFPRGEEMVALLGSAGLRDAKCKQISGGVVSIYTATA
jgi:demethylmenaquinone methyltransferase / 2-methoxy-6-polyprenyl-1,4-benzoquinol methylase